MFPPAGNSKAGHGNDSTRRPSQSRPSFPRREAGFVNIDALIRFGGDRGCGDGRLAGVFARQYPEVVPAFIGHDDVLSGPRFIDERSHVAFKQGGWHPQGCTHGLNMAHTDGVANGNFAGILHCLGPDAFFGAL